jgi:hypothetical protein
MCSISVSKTAVALCLSGNQIGVLVDDSLTTCTIPTIQTQCIVGEDLGPVVPIPGKFIENFCLSLRCATTYSVSSCLDNTYSRKIRCWKALLRREVRDTDLVKRAVVI